MFHFDPEDEVGMYLRNFSNTAHMNPHSVKYQVNIILQT
jgi:hypothetical protein